LFYLPNFSFSWHTLVFLLLWGCHVTPFWQVLLGLGFGVGYLGFVTHDSLWWKALTTSIVSCKRSEAFVFLALLCASVSIHGTQWAQTGNSQAVWWLPLHCPCQWIGWSIIHLLLRDGYHISVYQPSVCYQALVQRWSFHGLSCCSCFSFFFVLPIVNRTHIHSFFITQFVQTFMNTSWLLIFSDRKLNYCSLF
jgi:hypothetical protein